MPVEQNNFSQIDYDRANRAALAAMGAAFKVAAQEECPVQTGNLKRSHVSRVDGDHVDVGVTAEYGWAVHNGTKDTRPNNWLERAGKRNAQEISDYAVNAWERALNL